MILGEIKSQNIVTPDPTRHLNVWTRSQQGSDPGTQVPPRQLPVANKVATQTVYDYPELKNPPGRSRMTKAILKSLKLTGWCPWPWQTIQEYPGSAKFQYGRSDGLGLEHGLDFYDMQFLQISCVYTNLTTCPFNTGMDRIIVLLCVTLQFE